jgi:hypothetical protein
MRETINGKQSEATGDFEAARQLFVTRNIVL